MKNIKLSEGLSDKCKAKEEHTMKRYWLLAMIATVMGLMPMVACENSSNNANASNSISFNLVQASATVASCLPNATAEVTVFLNEETKGVDTLKLQAKGLPPNTTFAVFLTSDDAFATPPFGAVEYIGDFTTNAAGVGSLNVDAIIAEAFVSTLVSGSRVRADLDHLVFWFADPAQAQAACSSLTAKTPFDGDGEAGPAAMSSQGLTGLEQFP